MNEPVAIVGMACRFAGASSPDQFWEMIEQGRTGHSPIPKRSFDANAWYHPSRQRLGSVSSKFLSAIHRRSTTMLYQGAWLILLILVRLLRSLVSSLMMYHTLTLRFSRSQPVRLQQWTQCSASLLKSRTRASKMVFWSSLLLVT